MELVTIDNFSDKVGQSFQLVLEDGTSHDLSLTSAEAKGTEILPVSSRIPFSLFFKGTPGVLCHQAIYTVRHESGWQTDIFLVPIGANQDGTYNYQAVYS